MASISVEESNEVIEVVAGLEAIAADLACRAIADAEVEAIAAKHTRMIRAWKSDDNVAYFTLNREIHEAIIAAARNPTLQGIYATLSGRIQRARYAAHKSPEQWRKAVDEHEEMLRLLKAREGSHLGVLMREHIRGKTALILASYG